MSVKAPKFIISGAPASGKGTQCEFIKEKYNVVHLSTGDMLRAAVEEKTPVGLKAKEFMDSGGLVPDDVIIGIVMARLKKPDCATRGWLLDGFPRTRAQADALSKAGGNCDVFIQLDVDDELLVERVVGRRSDPISGKIYHLKYSPPPDDDEELLDRLVHRSDDTEEKVVVRIENYKHNLDSIVDKYADKMIRIDGNRHPNDVWDSISTQLNLRLASKIIQQYLKTPKFIISGAPASGKGTQCEYIRETFDLVHLSTGDMLRTAVEEKTPVGLKVQEYMDSGQLVPDEIIIGIVIARLKRPDCANRGWLLDGFPRTRAQADALSKAGGNCDVFIQLDVDDELLVERVVGRRSDPISGKIYHLKYSPPPEDDQELLDRLVHRSDDTEEKVVVRIENYKRNLDSIVDKYADKMIRINGNTNPKEVWESILTATVTQVGKIVSHTENKTAPNVTTTPAPAVAETIMIKPSKGPKFIISGAPASGKGTQCEFIKKEFNVVHLSTGDILRDAVEKKSPVGIKAQNYMDSGQLVPDEIIIGVVMERLSESDCEERGWLLDGFPRTRAQADALTYSGVNCDVFIQLDVDDDLLVERVVGRRMDPVSGKIYHLKYSPPPVDNQALINRLVHRFDDTKEKVVVRIENYKHNLDSIVDKYGDKMIRINGNKLPQDIWFDIHPLILRKVKYQVIFVLGG